MPKNRPEVTINLIGQPKQFAEKLLADWAINFGRVIIVVTELIALGAFGFRIYIDKQIIDLHDQIKTKESIVKGQEKQEKVYRTLQQRLTYINSFDTTTKKIIDTLLFAGDQVQTDTFAINRIAFSDGSISLDGEVSSIFDLHTLVENLKQHKEVETISVGELETENNITSFRLKINVEGITKAKPKTPEAKATQ